MPVATSSRERPPWRRFYHARPSRTTRSCGRAARRPRTAATVRRVACTGAVAVDVLIAPDAVDLVALVVLVGVGLALPVVGPTAVGARVAAGRPDARLTFGAGLVVLAVATQSGVARYDTTLFSAHVAQHVLLGMVAPVLLALGAPVTLALQAGQPAHTVRLRRALGHPAGRVLTNPLVAFAALRRQPLRRSTSRRSTSSRCATTSCTPRCTSTSCRRLACSPRRDRPRRRAGPPPPPRPACCSSLLTVPLHAFLGLALLTAKRADRRRRTTPLHRPPWAGSLLADQRTGAGIMWIAGELFGLVVAAVVVAQWMRHAEREARRLDRQLDEAAAASADGLPTRCRRAAPVGGWPSPVWRCWCWPAAATSACPSRSPSRARRPPTLADLPVGGGRGRPARLRADRRSWSSATDGGAATTTARAEPAQYHIRARDAVDRGPARDRRRPVRPQPAGRGRHHLRLATTRPRRRGASGSSGSGSSTTRSSGIDVTGVPGHPPELVLPVGPHRPARSSVADDVIHSFWVPEFLEKRDLDPGRRQRDRRQRHRAGRVVGRLRRVLRPRPLEDELLACAPSPPTSSTPGSGRRGG